jgi:hypothetical protein
MKITARDDQDEVDERPPDRARPVEPPAALDRAGRQAPVARYHRHRGPPIWSCAEPSFVPPRSRTPHAGHQYSTSPAHNPELDQGEGEHHREEAEGHRRRVAHVEVLKAVW